MKKIIAFLLCCLTVLSLTAFTYADSDEAQTLYSKYEELIAALESDDYAAAEAFVKDMKQAYKATQNNEDDYTLIKEGLYVKFPELPYIDHWSSDTTIEILEIGSFEASPYSSYLKLKDVKGTVTRTNLASSIYFELYDEDGFLCDSRKIYIPGLDSNKFKKEISLKLPKSGYCTLIIDVQ